MDDLAISPISNALAGCHFDVVVGGSIGAIEAPRFIRSLRRLGAAVTAWPTPGSQLFLGPDALAWASGKPVRQHFRGSETHLATADACVVAPASASNLSDLSSGSCSAAALAVVQSHRGQGNPVFVLPNMHSSLANAPAIQANLESLADQGFTLLGARVEEGKNKFPDPAQLADEVSHSFLGRKELRCRELIVSLGPTRSHFDDVRYLSNYSSGALGSAICNEAYRQGMHVTAVCGPANHLPTGYNQLLPVETNAELEARLWEAHNEHPNAAMAFVASVLDYVVDKPLPGKVSSGKAALSVNLVPSHKIIARFADHSGPKFACKLLAGADASEAQRVGEEYIKHYNLQGIIVNNRDNVSASRHEALWIDHGGKPETLHSKESIAKRLVDRVLSGQAD